MLPSSLPRGTATRSKRRKGKKMNSGAKLLEEFDDLATTLTKKFAAIHSLDWDDLISYVRFTILRDGILYDPKKSTRRTWAYQYIYWGCIECQHRRNKEPKTVPLTSPTERGVEEEYLPQKTSHSDWLDKVMEEMSEEGKHLIRITLLAPEELAELINVKTKVRSQKAIRSYLINELDWPVEKVDRAWAEVQEALCQ
jgi:hypothetical protein